MRRAYETLCPYDRTYERENTNAVSRLVQESKIQRITRTAYARAKLGDCAHFCALTLCQRVPFKTKFKVSERSKEQQ